jgi:hypothetical protein
MTRYADPSRCPDCRAAITASEPRCPACGLSLRGDTAGLLFATLSRADDLLTTLRAASTPSPAPTTSTGSVAVAGATAATTAPVGRRTRRLTASSVPQVLLGLGAACLLVAALVFLAVAWSVLGVGGRTATLVVLTVVAGALAATMARRGLRAAAESLSLVAHGLLVLDLVGADHSGWFGSLSDAGLVVLVGAVLAVSGLLVAVRTRRTPVGALLSAQVVAAVGAALLAVGTALGDWLPLAPSLLVATLAAGAVALVAGHARLVTASAGAAASALLTWTTLAVSALERAFDQPTWSALWGRREVWPLLAAAALAAAPALLRRTPHAARLLAVGVAALLVTTAVVAPAHRLPATGRELVALAVLLTVAAAGARLPRRWRAATLPIQAVAGLVVLVASSRQAGSAAERLLHLADSPWSGRSGDALAPADAGLGAPWLLPLAVVVLLVTLASVVRAVPAARGELERGVDRVAGSPTALGSAAAGLVAGSVVAAVALEPVAAWLVVGLLLLLAAAATVWAVVARRLSPLVPAVLFAAAGVVVSLHAAGLTLAALLVTLVLAAVVHLSSRPVTLAAAVGALVPPALAGVVWTVGHLAEVDPVRTAPTALVAVGALVLLAPYAPRRWWSAARPDLARTGLEAGAVAAAVPVGVAGVLLAPLPSAATWAAVDLTVAGVVVTLVALLREDRRRVAWAGGVLLALASWVRLADLGVSAPEAYTLPSALVLLAAGAWRMRHRPDTGTVVALAPGLSLALVPSLLWVLDDPTGVRTPLLGLACLALVLAGAGLRWTAPLLVGAGVGLLLVLRLAAPHLADALPRWVLIGGAGALLVAVGATWEQRLGEARRVRGYVRGLR